MADLFSEIKIRDNRFKNRLVMPPMINVGPPQEEGLLLETYRRFYEARARGGMGLIITEGACVNKTGRYGLGQFGLWSDAQIEGWKRLAEACHRYDCRVFAQLHHGGLTVPAEMNPDLAGPSPFHGRMGFDPREKSARALTVAEIHQIQEDFVAAAVRAEKAGLDGIELHGAHGYLVSQFFSPFINKRTDDYGGSQPNRARFAVEIIQTIRKSVGRRFIVDCRMGCNEPDLETSLANALGLEKAGVDLLHVSAGFIQIPEVGLPVPDGYNYTWIVYGGNQIKKKVKVPVIVVNGIKTAPQANNLIEQGLADFVAVGKGSLVDPEWANKARQNLEVKPCLECKLCAYMTPEGLCPQSGSRE